ncbi:MAG: SusC/RagA family TonB-linked outer membrane protein [Bacteroidota bacterium]|nr:SusC/RagA family TonB-linked outer membrane protein [Bacteroidota bacterium]
MKSRFNILLLLFMTISCYVMAQNASVIVQGTVTSKSNGETLIGVTVTEYDAVNRVVNATATDVNGHYVIKIKNTNDKLVFTYLGYSKVTHTIGTVRTINTVLEESQHTLKEVAVVGKKTYSEGGFNIPKREIATAVQTINSKDFEGLQVGSIDEALQGRVAGLDIVSNSGDPGSGSAMRIRGTSSINANTQPLIVLNGVPYNVEVDQNFDFANSNEEQYANMLSINPDDILEITVLKDAASTAIWGSKGANGVLMITTKKGSTGPTKLQYTYRLTRSVQPKGLNMLNGDDYTMMMKQALFNSKQNESAADIDEFNYDKLFSEYENFNNNTDWVKEVTRVGTINDHYLTVLGGGDRAQFRVSGGFYDQKGTVIGSGLKRYTTRATLDYTVSDRLKFGAEFSFIYSDNDRNYVLNKESILGIAYRKMPNVSVFAQNADGSNTNTYYTISRSSTLSSDQRDLANPVALANLAVNDLKTFRITPTFSLQYDLFDPNETYLRYAMYVNFDINNNKTAQFLPWEATNAYWSDPEVNLSINADENSTAIQADNNLTYQPRFENKDHNLTLMGSFQIRASQNSSQGFTSFGLISPSSQDASQNAYLYDMGTSRSQNRSLGLLARAHYSYKSRYILSGTFRRDGSTRFGNNRKFGNFPGVSGKWIISDEPFMEFSKGIISMLAIRPSWGLSGNEPDVDYLPFSRYSAYDSYINMKATRPTTLRLSDLKWETTSSFNYGADIGLFDDRIVLDLNAYNKRTYDLLFKDLSVPSTSGFSTVTYSNVGTMDNDGFEINVNANRIIKIGKFSADFNFNLSNSYNTIVKLDDKVLEKYNTDFTYTNGTYLTRLQEGNSYGSIYGFRYKGVYQYDEYVEGEQENAPVARDASGRVLVDEKGEPLPMTFAYGKTNQYEFRGGDAKYEDINHDGTIDELDMVYLGNSNPLMNGGFGTTLHYKDFSCVMFFNFRYGNKIVNQARMLAESMYNYDNQSIAVNWRWRKDGDLTEIPRALYGYGYNWLGSDRFVEDGSFLRFKYLQFNYAVPSSKLKPYQIDKLNFYLNFNNLACFTKYTGVDPEIGYGSFGVATDESKTPRSKDFTLGISIGF